MKIVDDYLDFLQTEISKKAMWDAKNALASLYKKEKKKSLIQKIIQGAPSKKQFVRREEKEEPCWKGYEMVGMKKKKGRMVPNCVPIKEEKENRPLNKPFRTPGGPKKFSVYVKNDKGNVVKVNFGDPNMEIKRDDPERRKSFRARHNCADPGPKWKARYWSCYQWRGGAKVED